MVMDANGVERERFNNISSADLRELSSRVLHPACQIVTYDEDPTLALWDFADAFLVDVDTFQSIDDAIPKFAKPDNNEE